MITNVPKRLQSDGALHGVLGDIKMPYPTTEVHIGREVGLLPDLIEKHQNLVRELEKALAKYLKTPKGPAGQRPTAHIGSKFGCGGQKVDAIDYYTAQINKTEAAIEGWRARIAEKKPQSYGFASMAAVPYAHLAARSLQRKTPQKLKIRLAPPPNGIIWKNLTLTKGQRARSSTIGFFYLVILLFLNAVPLLAVSLISNMGLFTSQVGFLRQWNNSSHWTFAAVAGLLPPLISGLAGYLLPILMRRIAKYRGVTTKPKLDKVILTQYFGYLVISQFLVFTLLGIVINLIATLVTSIGKQSAIEILRSIGSSLPQAIKNQYFLLGNYWLTWMPFRGYMALFDLAQVIKLLLVWFRKGIFGGTPREVREYTKPPSFDYAVYYANLLFMAAVVMLYATLVPLVVVLGAVAFWLSSVVGKYMLMFVNTTKHETGGALWRIVVNRLLICIIFMQVILVLAVLLDNTSEWYRIVACLPPILFVFAFKIYCARTFDSQFTWYVPSGKELNDVTIHKGDARHHRLQRRFGHPSLHESLWTPMVHAKVQHLLPSVYRGRIEDNGTSIVDGRKMQTEKLDGGLKIAIVEEDQLEYDPAKDSDSRSVMSGTTVATGLYTPNGPGTPLAGIGAYGGSTSSFKQQYAQYLASGQVSANGDDYEMGNMGRESRDNLLENTQARYSDSAEGTLVGSGHVRRPSGDVYGAAMGTPDMNMQRHASAGDPMAAGYGLHTSPQFPPMRQASGGPMQQQYMAQGQGTPGRGPPLRQNSNFSGYSSAGYVSANSSPQNSAIRMTGANPAQAAGTMYAPQHPHTRSGSGSSQQVMGAPVSLQPGMMYPQASVGMQQPGYPAARPPPQQQQPQVGQTFAPGQFVNGPGPYAQHPQDPYGQRRQSPGPGQGYRPTPGYDAGSYYS